MTVDGDHYVRPAEDRPRPHGQPFTAAPVVHVRDVAGHVCRPALVLALPVYADASIRARVVKSSGFGPVGLDDEEGMFAPTSAPIVIETTPPRTLDHWHRAEVCPF